MPGLLAPAERKARQAAKQDAALRFLRQVLYSTPEILGRAMGLNTSAGWYRTLHQLEREHLITASAVDWMPGRSVPIWGITPHGQAVASARLDLPHCTRYFEPGRASITTLMHFLGLQKLQLQAEAAGWTEWTYGDFQPFYGREKQTYRPDAIARTSRGRLAAVEYERTLKTPKRYREILGDHLTAIKAGKVEGVIWVCDDPGVLACVEKHLKSFADVVIDRTRVHVDPVQDHKPLYFRTFADFPAPQRLSTAP